MSRMARLNACDPVTVVVTAPGVGLCAAHAIVSTFYTSAERVGFYFMQAVIVSLSGATVHLNIRATGRFMDEEGTTWIRGHQTGDAIVALLAAAALDAGAIPTEPYDSDYSTGGYALDRYAYLDDNHPVYKDGSWLAR